MTTKCYIVEDTILSASILTDLCFAIPCFYSAEMIGDGYLSITITCRDADVRTVEKYIAEIV